MLHIDRKNKDGKRIRYYYSNTSTYQEAIKSQPSDIRMLQLAESVVDISSNKIIKCRFMIEEVFDAYYENKAFENSIIHE